MLVGTAAIETSERLSKLLDRAGVPIRCSTPSSTNAKP